MPDREKQQLPPETQKKVNDADALHAQPERHEMSDAVRNAIQEILNKSKGFPENEGESFHGLEGPTLELARIWCWQNFPHNQYNTDSVLGLYNFIQESLKDGLPLGPTAFRYCESLEGVRAQHQRTKEILGANLEAFAKGEKIDVKKIGDYEIKMHRHDCEFGSGLITLSMWRQDRKVFQASFYPSDPFKVYEIKGSKPGGDKANIKRKRDYHRFNYKYGLAPSSALIVECLKIAQGMGLEVEVAGWASLWRNYGLADNEERREQADSVYWKVRQDLELKYDQQTEAIIETAEALNKIYSEPKTEEDSQESWRKYERCCALISSLSNQHAILFNSGKDEFVTKLLFSSYRDEHISKDYDTMLWCGSRSTDKYSWTALSNAVTIWARQNFQIPQSSSGYSRERDPKEDWLRFNLPLFMRVDIQQRDKIIADHPQLNKESE